MSILSKTPQKSNLTETFSRLSAALVALLAAGAFLLSYNALRAVAARNGLPGWQSFLWPLLIDFALIVFSLAVVRNALLGERTRWPWFLVALYTAATVGFNILHAPSNLTARVVAVVAPVSLFLSFETLMAQLRSEVCRTETARTLSELTAEAERLAERRDELAAALDALARKRDALTAELSELRAAKRRERASGLGNLDAANASRQAKKEQAQRALLSYQKDHPYASLSEIGQAIGRSKTTAGSYINELMDAGRLHKNGQGWQVFA